MVLPVPPLPPPRSPPRFSSPSPSYPLPSPSLTYPLPSPPPHLAPAVLPLGVRAGTFPLTTEHYLEPARELARLATAAGVGSRFVTLRHGEGRDYGWPGGGEEGTAVDA